VDPTDSPPPRRTAGHGDDQPGSVAGGHEGERRPHGSNGGADVLSRKYGLLHPGERQILAMHKHPAVLIWNIFLSLVVAAIAFSLTGYLNKKAGTNGNVIFNITLFHHVEKVTGKQDIFILGILLVYGLTLSYLVYKVLAWVLSFLVITDRQIIVTAGLLVLRFASVRISQVTSWYLRESLGGRALGYKFLVFKVGDGGGVVRTIGYVPSIAVGDIEEALPSDARNAGDEEAFKQWAAGSLRRRVRLVIAGLLICLLIALGVTAAINPRVRTGLNNEAEIIALLPILIILITPKS
jgi:hypothetical protein